MYDYQSLGLKVQEENTFGGAILYHSPPFPPPKSSLQAPSGQCEGTEFHYGYLLSTQSGALGAKSMRSIFITSDRSQCWRGRLSRQHSLQSSLTLTYIHTSFLV